MRLPFYWVGRVLSDAPGRSEGPALRGRAISRNELIADATHGQQDLRRCRAVFDVPPQPYDEVVDRARVGALVQTPDVFEDRPARDRLSGVHHQIAQQVALHLRQPMRLAQRAYFHRSEVERAAGERVYVRRIVHLRRALLVPPAAAKQSIDAGEENGQLEGLREVVVGARLEAAKH